MSARSNRRSSRARRGSGEIVAPGYGTKADVQKLQKDLGGALPVIAVTAMLRSEGRGIRGASDPDVTTTVQTSSAWADFIHDEGAGTISFGMAGSTSEEPASKKQKTDEGNAADPQEQSDYDLSVLVPSKKKAPTGTLVQCGTLDSSVIGRKAIKSTETAVYHLNIPTSLLPKVAIAKVCTSCNASHTIAIDRANQAYGWGRNEALCLGDEVGESKVIPTPQIIASNIQTAALGKSHTIFLQLDGSLHAMGQNKSGQCGWRQNVKSSGTLKPCQVNNKDIKFARIACGEDFSVALDEEGILYSAGSSEFGQLANGETGEYFVSANKLAFANSYGFADRTIFHQSAKDSSRNDQMKKTTQITQEIRLQDVACGKHFAIALEAPKENGSSTRVFSWGSGNYGCLGHGRQQDEYYPRVVEMLPNGMVGTNVAAGSTCSLVLTSNGHVYYWGQHQSSKDAVMKPQLVDALANNQHDVKKIGSGSSFVVCSTSLGSTVVWGQGPYGELGLGSKKSSSKPAFVEPLEGIKILDLACGQGSVVYVVEEEKNLPTLDTAAVEAALG
ncbi:unnamed protein product [Cylindrotheca closterium]|uniref:RCC1-like domain-containing protein n=1 Tax=Cylindrotheca closterium TaxID=2856 RepID=A0AAD2CV61_9STRA|nr:unnamed protein product [Cylindrotheca closterium]